MANTLLTPTAVTREALRILHQSLNFLGKVNRTYDDSYAQEGAKIGDTLKIRLPNQYTVRTGATIDVQDTVETSVSLQVSTQKGVDMAFTTKDLTMDLDDFSTRILEPAMSVLAANIENDAMSMYKDVYNEISDVDAAVALIDVLNSSKRLTDSLAPGKGRTLNLNTQDNVDLVSALSGLFNPQSNLSDNYRDGMVANHFVGYNEVYENTMWPTHLTGTDDGTGDYKVDETGTVAEGSTSITVQTGAGTWKKGDIFFFASVNEVHPETKVDQGRLQAFVMTADVAANATTINFAPTLYSSGPKQNVSAMPADNAAVTKFESDRATAIGNAADYRISMGFHRDAFAFSTADLLMPQDVHWKARSNFDGITIRCVRQYDINNDNIPCRLDVLYGFKTIRPELACRIGMN